MKLTGSVLLFLLLALLPVAGRGQEMEVTIDVLEPTDEPGELPPGLRYLEETMSNSPLKYQNYLELATAFRSIPLGREETISFNLRQKIKIVIIPTKVGKETVSFRLKLRSGGRLILDTELSLARRGTVMIGAPGKPNLIIAVSEGF
jgi:hypothetical protein